METVGIRELKNKLSAYVRKVEAGDVVIVTDRGRVVAELVPPGWHQYCCPFLKDLVMLNDF